MILEKEKTIIPDTAKVKVVTPTRFAIKNQFSVKAGKSYQNVVIYTDDGDSYSTYKSQFDMMDFDVSKVKDGDRLEITYIQNGLWKNFLSLELIKTSPDDDDIKEL